jgi:hypothetical protein
VEKQRKIIPAGSPQKPLKSQRNFEGMTHKRMTLDLRFFVATLARRMPKGKCGLFVASTNLVATSDSFSSRDWAQRCNVTMLCSRITHQQCNAGLVPQRFHKR